MIIRPRYLDILRTYHDVPLVKILSGIRRCGKFTILEMLRKEMLESGTPSDHIISLRYTSANAIVKFLKNEGRALSVETVYNYLEWLEKAFVIYRCPRYDLQGKSVLKTQEKFYLADTALKYSIMGFNPKSIAAMLENIVYFELRRKGYEVYVGKNEKKEVDFVAVKRDERVYVQVCRRLPEESDREVANLLEIKDHYPKYVVTLDEFAAGNFNGVKIVHLSQFLLSEKY